MRTATKEAEILAVAAHGALTVLHALGVTFNVMRGDKRDATIHFLVLCFDLCALRRHMKRVRK